MRCEGRRCGGVRVRCGGMHFKGKAVTVEVLPHPTSLLVLEVGCEGWRG